ncbi:VOC family protein [Paraglaciecola sp.]|jgi:predicted enzyme related to lactoylglutathione lyase|nr:VOC family protein [Paraglaciecola sp.]MDB4281815.1 VOC family protein [Paraglaciecola sp.]
MHNSIIKIGQLAITVSNVKQALAFYRDILGLTFLFSPSENLAFLSCGDTRIMLNTPKGAGEVGKNSILYFTVTDITKVFKKL